MSLFNDASEAFLTWFSTQPGTTWHPSLRITDLRNRSAGRGIIAIAEIPPETDLFTIPRSAIISEDTSELAARLPQLFPTELAKTDGSEEGDDEQDGDTVSDLPTSWLNLILILLYESFHQQTSNWKPYLDILPQTPESFHTLMFWSDNDLQQLQASAIRSKIGKHSADRMFRERIMPTVRQHADVFYPLGTRHLNDEELLEKCHVIGSMIMSYAFDLQPDEDDDEEQENEDGWVEDYAKPSIMGMAPMADMLNADAEFNAHLSHGEDSLTMTSLRVIKAGEEVLNYYGPLPNAELLRRYGYTTPKHARHDVVEISWQLVQDVLRVLLIPKHNDVYDSAALQLFESVLRDLANEPGLEDIELEDGFILERESGDLSDEGVFTSEARFSQIPDDLDRVASIVIAKMPDPYPGRKSRDQKALVDIKQKKLEVFQKIIEKRCDEYSSSLEEDEKLLAEQGKDLPLRMQRALDVRIGEKRLLREALSWLREKQEKHSNGPSKRKVDDFETKDRKRQRAG